jgi:uncharacterized delta-60 repeat protein
LRPFTALRLFALAPICAALLACATPAAALSPGDPDPSFGANGVVYSALGAGPAPAARYNALALQPDGKIVLAGFATDANGNRQVLVERLNHDGSPDSSFADGGLFLKQYGTGVSGTSAANAVAVQPDGKIVVGVGATTEEYSGLIALRLKPNGELDPSFGDDGLVSTEPNPLDGGLSDWPSTLAIALQPDGKILLGGDSELYHAGQLLLTRLNGADGSVDSSFGDGGRLLLSLQPRDSLRPYSYANALAVQPDGKILVAGTTQMVEISELVLMRLAGADGAPDPTFGDGGKLLYGPFGEDCGAGGAGNAIGLQPDGKVVVAGSVNGAVDCSAPTPVFRSPGLLARFDGAGFDSTFGTDGALFTDTIPGGPASASFQGLSIRPDGKFVVGGYTYLPGLKIQSLVARLDGAAMDPTFGNGGTVPAPLAGGDESSAVEALTVQPDGKILAAGFAGCQAAVTRLMGDGAGGGGSPVGEVSACGGSSPGGGGSDSGGGGGAGPGGGAPQGDGSTRGASGAGANQLAAQNLVATLSKLGISPSSFSAASSGPSIARTVGARVSYENTQAATTMLTVLKRTRGVHYERRCLRPARHRHGRRCARWVVAGRFVHADKAGLNSFHFTGRVYGRKLKPGRYKLRARPRFAGPAGKAIEVTFRIVK